MKQMWLSYSAKIDALGLRERVIIFFLAVVILVALFDTMAIEPPFLRETELSKQIEQDQGQIAGLQAEIQAKIKAYDQDPDVSKRAKLAALLQKSNQMRTTLQDMQKGLVSPDRMSTLLQDILRQNGKLRLVALHTLPVSGLNDPPPDEKKADEKKADDKKPEVKGAIDAAAQKLINQSGAAHALADAQQSIGTDGELVYKHGVELVIEGSYLDMVDYMTTLEGMPWQLFWGKAKLEVDESNKDSRKLTMTLTLYTLSLDKNWLKI